MKIVYSFNKTGYEAQRWITELKAASDSQYTFIPFNHDPYLNPKLYLDSYKLDCLYQARDARLMKMYSDFEACLHDNAADAILVYNVPPYHPDFLKKQPVYKALFSGDDPDSTYKRNIPYLHAYHHVFYLDPAYSPDMDMNQKMRYAGMVNADWLPMAVYDFEFDTTQTEETIMTHTRDVDIVYVGHCFPQKLPLLTTIKRAFGPRFRMHGFYRLKHNLYLNVMHRYGGWVKPVSFPERVRLYQRAKIGFNVHWNNYGLGNQRLYQLPANGVMQICDCPDYLNQVFQVGEEIISFNNPDDLIDKIKYYLNHEDERRAIALAGYRRAMRDYRIGPVTRQAAKLMQQGMHRIGWRPGVGTREYVFGSVAS